MSRESDAMSRKVDFEAMKALFESQLRIPDRTFQGFNGLITRANTQHLRLSEQERAELHQIYKPHKLGLLDKILSGKGEKEYPIKQMVEVVSRDRDKSGSSGLPMLSKAEITRMYTAVLDAKLQHRDEKPEKMTLVAGMELDRIISERTH
jgi:hypothetical protein